MDKYLIKTPPNLINDLRSANNRRSSFSLSHSIQKNKLSTPQSAKSSIKSKRNSIASAAVYINKNYSTSINENSRDVLLKKYFAINDSAVRSNDVSSKTRLSLHHINHSEMSLLVNDIENISPASPLARSFSQLTMDNSVESDKIEFNAITPKQNPCFDKIKRGLDSPSATVRIRALQALKSPSKIQNYYGYDVPDEEIDIITEEERRTPEKPKSIQEIMKDVVVYIEVRNGVDNRSAGIKNIMHMLGATVNDKLLRNTTHVIFKDGLLSTYNKAKRWSIPIVSILWVEACKKFKQLMNPKYYPISDMDKYENPDMKKIRKYKSMQPDVEDIIKSSRKVILNRKIDKIRELNCDNDSDDKEDDDVFENVSAKKSNRKHILHDTIKNCDEMIKNMSSQLQHLSQKSDGGDTSSAIFVQDPNQTDNASTKMNLVNDSNVTVRRSRRNSSIYSSILNRDCSTPIDVKIPSCSIRKTTYVDNMDISTNKTFKDDDPANNTTYTEHAMDESSNKSTVEVPTPAHSRRTLFTPKYNDLEIKDRKEEHSNTSVFLTSAAIVNKHHRRTIIGLSKPTPKSDVFNPHLDMSIEPLLDEPKKLIVETSLNTSLNTSSVKRRRTLYTPQLYTSEKNVDDIDQNQVDSESKKIKEKELSKIIAERKKLRRSLFPLTNSTSANSIDEKSNIPETKLVPCTEQIAVPTVPEVSSLILPPTGVVKKRKLFTSSNYCDAPSDEKNIQVAIEKPKKTITQTTPTTKTKTTARRSTMEFEMIKPKVQTFRPLVAKTDIVTANKQREQVMVVTNMHKNQIDVVKEAIKNLGRFKLEQTVTDRTTHLVSFEPRRTINMLRGIIRGIWILNFDWIIDSNTSNSWLHEEFYELKIFSKAVQLCRTERQAFEGNYKIDLFQDIEPIFISPKSTIPIYYLRELIKSCSGQLTNNIMKSRYVLGEKLQNENVLCLNPLWILDSIQENKIMKISKYVLRYDNER